MSIFWRKAYAAGEYTRHAIIKREDGSIPLCNACICPESWYIATLCPCEICGNDPCAIGLHCSYPTDTEDPLYEASVAGAAVTLDGEEQLSALSIEYQAPQDASSDTPVSAFQTSVSGDGCKLYAIKHTTPAAPFDGTVEANVYFNGDLVGTWNSSCSSGVAQKVGNNTFDEGYPYAAIKTGTTSGGVFTHCSFDGKGVHTVDIKVVWAATDTEAHPNPIGYTCRTAVRVLDSSSFDPEVDDMGDVGIVPGWYIQEETMESTFCPFTKTVDGFSVQMMLSALKGPFDTLADAEYVLDEFSEQIADYAETCICRRDFLREGLWQVDDDGSNGARWIEDVCPTSYQECVHSDEPYWRVLDWGYVDMPTGWRAELLVNGFSVPITILPNDPSTGWAYFFIPPCANVHERLYVDGSDHSSDPPTCRWKCYGVGFTTIGGTRVEQECFFCTNEKEGSFWCKWHMDTKDGYWLSDWTYTALSDGGPAGVPNNSSDLADYIEGTSI